MMRPHRYSDHHVAEEIARLGDLTREELIERWIRAHGHPPPKGISRRLLEFTAAYALQSKAFGGLNPPVKRALAAALDPPARPSTATSKPPIMKPGTQLVRVWNGRTHYVEVLEKGFIWNGERFRSLTAVAYRITGARWSGPRFFGL